ncbi:restriction endonuclease, partial [Campylobacter coli]|nr:restriction endonuclease [Campylobacter coli]
YRNAFRQTSDYKKLKESKIYKESKDKQDLEDKAFLAYAQAIEKDKLLYFSLSLNQEVLIIKSPSDIKEQKKFLGYEWSNRKGDEGLKELHNPYLSPLFERGNPQNETKLNTLIYKSFLNTLDVIPQELQTYATKARLVDMIDFEKVEFNKAISLNPKTQREEIKSQYPLVKLKICGDFFMGGTPSRKNINYWNGDIKWLTISDYSNRQVIMDTKEKITREGFKNSNAKMIQKGAVVVSIYATIGRVGILGEDMTTNQAIVAIIPNEEFINKYLMYAIDYFKFQLYNEVITTSQQNINLGILQNMVIPKPPLEIQKQIVAECEKVEEQHNTLSLSIKEYQNLIKAMLQKCGIIEDNQEYELNSILENLQKLESKLDFNLLFSFIDDFTNARQEDLKKFKEFVKNIKAILGTFSTPPKQGWNKEKLNEIVSIQSGGTPDRKVKEYWNGNINWVKSEVCQNCYVYDYQVKEKITELGLQKSSAKLLKKETTLIALVGATIGKIGFLTFESATNQNITGLYPKNLKILNTKYLYYACMGLYGQFRKLGDFAMANSNFIKNLTISLPPLEIQEKIVQNIELVEQQIDFLNLKLEFLEKEKEKILQKYLFS